MKTIADVIIIGGGIVGCASAYYLKKKGVKDIVVLEGSDSIGHGASSRNGGGVRQSGRDTRELGLAMTAVQKFWPTLSEELGRDVEYTQKGNLRLGKTQAHIKKLTALKESCEAGGLKLDMISGDEVRKIAPCMSEDVIGASFCPTDGHANPLVATLAYYMKDLELGVRFFTGAFVDHLEKVHDKVRKVCLKDGTIFEAGDIILAAGYDSRRIMNSVGLDVPMNPLVDCALVTEMEPEMFPQMLGTAAADFYGHQTRHGSFVFGAESGLEEYMEVKDPNDQRQQHAATLGASCRAIESWIPALAKAKIVRSWSGILDCTKDGVCVLGRPEEAEGLILACGFNGHGFGTAPAVGYIMAQEVVGEKPITDIGPLRYERFYEI